MYRPSDPSDNVSITPSTCRLWDSSKTVAMIFSILTAISQPVRFCS